jgi:hypothetical protein
MRVLTVGSALLAVLIWQAAVAPAMAQAPFDLRNPNIDILYEEPLHAIYRPIYARLTQRKVLEELRQFLAPLKLGDNRILVKVAECGLSSEAVTPPVPAVICYEYMHLIEQYAPKTKTAPGVSRADAIAGAFVLASLHQTARAVFHVLNIPLWGRETDAADKLSTYLMLQFGKDVAWRARTGTASFFEASKRTWTGSDFSDTDAPEEQRFYNFLCLAYGSEPDLFKPFVQKTLLTTRRAQYNGCFAEYNQVDAAFKRTLWKHIDPILLDQVRKVEWLRPDDGSFDK